MEKLIREWDGECVISRYDAPSDSWIFVAIHDRTLGMALGGCRFKIYGDPREGLREALSLARAMTYKWAAVELPFGGGKAVIAPRVPLVESQRHELLLRFGDLLHSLGGLFGTGVGLGTTSADMNLIGERAEWVFGRTPEHGGSGDPGPWTALGVRAGIRAAVQHVFGSADLTDRTVLIQGVGNVGEPLARRLAAEGARLLIADAIPSRAAALADELGGTLVPPQAVYGTRCDVFAPCAIGGVLNERSVPHLNCRIVAGSANNQLERDDDADALHAASVVYVPDFVMNAGGAIAQASLEVLRLDTKETTARVERIGAMVSEILAASDAASESPRYEAERRAHRVLDAAARVEDIPSGPHTAAAVV